MPRLRMTWVGQEAWNEVWLWFVPSGSLLGFVIYEIGVTVLITRAFVCQGGSAGSGAGMKSLLSVRWISDVVRVDGRWSDNKCSQLSSF